MSKDIYNQMETTETPGQLELNEILYNCTECSSPIEILSINDNNIEFKCINNNHTRKMLIKEYLDKMKEYNDKSINNDKCKIHVNNKYDCYCLDCKIHLCKECLKLGKHSYHYKIYLIEIFPNNDSLNKIRGMIEDNKRKIKNLNRTKIKTEKKLNDILEKNINKIRETANKMMEKNSENKNKELEINNRNYREEMEKLKKEYENKVKALKLNYNININNIKNKYSLLTKKIN